jgi:hypothetical protein
MDTNWYDEIAAEVRKLRGHDDDGTIWVLFLDDDRRPHVSAVLPPAVEIGAAEFDGLAKIVDEVDAPAVVIAVPRPDGEPRPDDWRVWEELRARLLVGRCELVDLVVVGEESWWAVVGGRPGCVA